MSTVPNPGPFDSLMADIGKEIQADFDKQAQSGTTPLATPPTPSAPAPGAEVTPATTPAPAATTAPGEKLYAGTFKTLEELERAHHLLIHNVNSVKAEQDKLLERVAAPPPAAPLTPGRVDPAVGMNRNDPEYQKWVEQYGIDPSDIEAVVDRKLAALREAEAGPARAMQAADAYMTQTYPDFLTRIEEVKVFIAANEAVRSRVAALWANGQYGEAMEIGYLAYDNALRAAGVVANGVVAGTQFVEKDRGDATMIQSQAGGAREVTPSPDAYPQTAEDWARIRELRASGRDAEANRILYGPLIRHIPDLNPGMQR